MTSQYKPASMLLRIGRDPRKQRGVVNPPIYRASTIIYDSLEEFDSRGERRFDHDEVVYGLNGTPTTFAFEEAMAEIEGAERALALPSGLAAVAVAFLCCVKSGDHVLVADTVYQPTRTFCLTALEKFGVETTFYDPRVGDGISKLFRPNTRLVFMESPGSLTFEIQDVPAISAAARSAGIPAALDNTWATPLLFRPFDHGADISIQAATKYIGGHADLMLGTVSASGDLALEVRKVAYRFGYCVGPEECYLGLRGLRTLAVRLERHQQNGLRLARWLEKRPEVHQVLHPALEGHPDHAIWKRDFRGACGLFSVVLNRPYPRSAIAAMVEGYELFGLGASWGGYESLVMPGYPEKLRTASTWKAPGPLIRYHAGLDDPDDLIADLEAGFERLHAGSA